MTGNRNKLPTRSSSAEVDAFLRDVAAITPAKRTRAQGRLLFAMDATASREPMWDRACRIQSEMFTEAARVGGLAVQLCHYGGFYGFESTPWLTELGRAAPTHECGALRGGDDPDRASAAPRDKAEAERARVNAVVFVGDCMEEDVDRLCAAAGSPASAQRPGVRVPGRLRPRSRAGVPGDRHPDPRRVLPVRCIERSGVARPVARGRGLRSGRPRSAGGLRTARRRHRQAARALARPRESSQTCTPSCCSSRSSRCCSSSVGTSEFPRRSSASSGTRRC